MVGPFELDARVEAGCVIMRTGGEFTRHSCGRILNALRHVLRPAISKVIIDVGELTYLSASSLAELAEIRRHLAGTGCRVILAGRNPQVQRLLSLSSLDTLIETSDDVANAVASP